jgi:Flp pilus assembly protein TadD
MAKRKSRTGRGNTSLTGRRWRDELTACEDLLSSGRLTEARDRLEDLDRRHPGRVEILAMLVNVHFEMNDLEGYQLAAERYLVQDPDDADVWLGLAAAYLRNTRVASALHTARQFVQRWPQHSKAVHARQMVVDLEAMVPPLLAALDLPAKDGFDLLFQHEQAQSHLARGEYEQFIRVTEALLQRYPRFAPALNNVSQACWMQGETERAIEYARRVLDFCPHNVHALSNLVHFLCARGDVVQASVCAQRLKECPPPDAELWVKQAEAFSYLGDDQGMLDLLHCARQAAKRRQFPGDPEFCHLAAVAMLRQGREKDARRLWLRALKIAPEYSLARDNLDDLQKPVYQRHAPWPFSVHDWLPPTVIQHGFGTIANALRQRSRSAVTTSMRRTLDQYPELVAVAPLLLDRGDQATREVVLSLADVLKDPQLLAALRDFALSQRGPDRMRIEAARIVIREGLLPSGTTRMWIDGAWQDTLLVGFVITDEPVTRHPPHVEKLVDQAIALLRARDGRGADDVLKQALVLKPDAPDLLNNLAMAYELQGRQEEAETLLDQVHARFPDYLFGRVAAARRAALDGEIERARELLDPLMRRRELHTAEFSALCGGFVELHLAEKNAEVAEKWCKTLESVLPDDPALGDYRSRVALLRFSDALTQGLLHRRSRRRRPADRPE